MGMLEDAISKTKDFLEIACIKTDEILTTEKIKFKITSLKSKRQKDYAKLGKICFNELKDNEDLDENLRTLVDEIIEKSEEISYLNTQLQVLKNRRVCTNCGAGVEQDSCYCNKCGIKFD